MIELKEALILIKMHIREITDVEYCKLQEAVGRIAAENVTAPIDQPPFPRSPLDGYGVSAEDVKGASDTHPVLLTVVEDILAGKVTEQKVQRGQSVRVMTGALLPEGVDTVIRQEDTDYGEKRVRIYKDSQKYENYCRQGEDFHQGEVLIKKGDKLDAVRIAVAAAMGYDKIPVLRLPRIAVLTTGSELAESGEQLEPGKIYDSNRFFICARLQEMGIYAAVVHKFPDDAEEMANYIAEIENQSDLIITTGGVSVGKKDILHDVLKILDAKLLFWKLHMKPGSPVMASVYRKTCILSLSGNPFAAAVGLEVLVRPALTYMTGNAAYLPLRQEAVMEREFQKESPVMRMVRGVFREGKVTVPIGSLASGVLSTMISCNCLVEMKAGTRKLKKGDRVWVTLL